MSHARVAMLNIVASLEEVVEQKVKAATTASAITGFIVILLSDLTVFHDQPVPTVITSAVGSVVTAGLTYAAGWLARHTVRATEITPPPEVPESRSPVA